MKTKRFLLFIAIVSFIFTSCSNNKKTSATTTNVTNYNWDKAQWIGISKDNRSKEWSIRLDEKIESINTPLNKPYAAPLLRKSFVLAKDIKSAKIAVCGLGLHELYVNGNKVSDHVLSPAQTSYNKRAFYVEHDVTKLLNPKNNAIGIFLGNGFFGQNIALSKALTYGQPRAILVVNITYKDGTTQQIVTDNSWKAHQSPLLFDNIYLGETYDARKDIANWSTPEYNDVKWDSVAVLKAPTKNILKQDIEPMRKIRKVDPIAVLPANEGYILDMGQNMTGWLQIKVKENKGTAIKMKFAEHLMPDKKNIDPKSTGIHVTKGSQTDIYICNGSGTETWEPRFTYHGFRYVHITGLTSPPKLENFTGWLVRTDVNRIGTFECSDPLINKYYNVSLWTLEDNIQGILTDCPHRERCAWLGDTYAVAEMASYNFNMQQFWQKTVADFETVLGADVPHDGEGLPADPRAPCNIGVGKRHCKQARPDWGAATVMVPWFSYIYYNDLDIVNKSWPMMTGWMAYLDEIVVQNGIIEQGYGDWCPPGDKEMIDTPKSLTSTALYYQSLLAMQKMATAQNFQELANTYLNRAQVVKKAFNDKFFNIKTNSYGSQTGNVFALYSKLVPENKEQVVADNLVKLIMKDKNGHYSTGIFGHRPLYTVLNDYGHGDITKHLWTITDYPSLGYMTEKHGLTTWPEVPLDWDAKEPYPKRSFNHPMHSGFAATFHESLGGIRPDETHPGFKKFLLQPTFLPDVNWIETSYESVQGMIKSNWKQNGETIVWSVTVPKGTTAKVILNKFNKNQINLNGKPVLENTFILDEGKASIKIKLK